MREIAHQRCLLGFLGSSNESSTLSPDIIPPGHYPPAQKPPPPDKIQNHKKVSTASFKPKSQRISLPPWFAVFIGKSLKKLSLQNVKK